MINIDCLNEVCEGLLKLKKQYALNRNTGDLERAKGTDEAYKALRKVILFMEIQGDIKNISPEKVKNICGWAVTDQNNNIKHY